nr:hypothetical protein [Tanacetum cinerariifolium]
MNKASSGSFTALAVTDQDGAMRLAIAAEFPESKHRLCVKKPNKVKVNNLTCVRPKGHEKQKRIKSGREISMKKRKNNVDFLYPAVVALGGSDHVDGGL